MNLDEAPRRRFALGGGYVTLLKFAMLSWCPGEHKLLYRALRLIVGKIAELLLDELSQRMFGRIRNIC